MMIRTFHSIGQGAFYTEEFDNFRFIYDCGTDTDGKKRIEGYIKNHLKENDVINALFISHFHRDHINGLEYLLSNTDVKYIFIPQYDIYQQALDFVCTDRNLNSFNTGLTINPVDAIKSISPKTKVITIKRYTQKNDSNEVDLETLNDGAIIDSGKSIKTCCIPNWRFIPINHNNTNSILFQKHLKALKIEFHNASDFISAWQQKTIRDKIKKAFKRLPKNPNENSMVVYSGPKINSVLRFSHYITSPANLRNHCINQNVGCIYFGDYETGDDAWNTIINALKDHYDLAGVIQIPHHGSSNNYRDEINKNDFVYSVISYGTKNTHKHPSSFTIRSILNNNGIPLEVTETPSTKLHFRVQAWKKVLLNDYFEDYKKPTATENSLFLNHFGVDFNQEKNNKYILIEKQNDEYILLECKKF